jgi:putative membrane protein
MDYLLIKYLHILGILVLFATLVLQHTLLKPEMRADDLQRLAKIDRLYGISALVVLIAGLLLWFMVGKDASFYTKNPIFHIKVTLFVVVGILSIFPTLFFAKQAKSSAASITVPTKIVIFIRIELLLLLVIPLLAVLMTNGVGL